MVIQEFCVFGTLKLICPTKKPVPANTRSISPSLTHLIYIHLLNSLKDTPL